MRKRRVQRLTNSSGVGNPYSFGSGPQRGGFGKPEYKALYDTLTLFVDFDYMGAAEYEWDDAVPKAFMLLNDSMQTGSLTSFGMPLAPERLCYVLCDVADINKIRLWLLDLANGMPGLTRDFSGFREAVVSEDEDSRIVGWIDLGYPPQDDCRPFIFTLSPTVYDRFMSMYGLNPKEDLEAFR